MRSTLFRADLAVDRPSVEPIIDWNSLLHLGFFADWPSGKRGGHAQTEPQDYRQRGLQFGLSFAEIEH